MTDVTELEQRIITALDRIAYSADQITSAPAAPDADMVEELEIERDTNARLVESGQQNLARIERLETRVSRMTDRLEFMDGENKRLQAVMAALRDTNKQLRAANAENTGAGDLINSDLEAENEALNASRVADLAELDDILGQIEPLVKEG
jgi:small-conductance mechanosensitive channel